MKENHVRESEIPCEEMLEKMRKNIYNNFPNYSISSINKDYIKNRNSIFKILQKVAIKMGFKSQTFFLSVYYLDIVFMKKKKINISLYKIGLASIVLSAKHCENDPIVPPLQYFIKVYNYVMGYRSTISMNDLMYAEVLLCKLLNYKLNYFSMYDFNSFFFCHGVFKLEQIKDIENDISKNYLDNKKEYTINSVFIKNILDKIYKKSRYYLDSILKMHKICFRYSPLFIAVVIVKKSIQEILLQEHKKNNVRKEKEEIENDEYCKKNYLYFKEIMNDFYKIDYESSEQYQKLIEDEEIKILFKEEVKKEIKDEEKELDKNIKIENNNSLSSKNENNSNTINTTSNNNTNNNKLNTSVTNGFYKKIEILPKENDNFINRKRNSINFRKNNIKLDSVKEDNQDDLDSNLNINELRKSQISKNEKMYKTKKLSNAANITENDSDENSKLKKINSNKILKFKKNIKPQRLKFNLSNVSQKDDMNNLNKSTNDIYTKKPYIKKLVHLNTKEVYNPKNNFIKASTSTNFYNKKMSNSLSSANIQLNTSSIDDKNSNNNDKEINSYSYIKSFNKKNQYKRESLNQRLDKKLKSKNIFDKNNNNNISKDYGKNNSINSHKTNSENVKSMTSDNFYTKAKNKTTASNKNINDSDMKNININEEIKNKRLSYILGKKNKDLNNSLKQVNKSLTMNFIEENKRNKSNTERNFNTKENLSNKGEIKKLDTNKLKTKVTTGNLTKSKIAQKTKKLDKNKSFYNNTSNASSTSIKEYKMKNKDINKDKDKEKNKNATQDNIQSSIFKIIKKTKDFFTNSNKEDEDDKDKGKDKNKAENKSLPNQNFYKTQTNFYKKKTENKNGSANANTSDNEPIFNRKNSSTIIINNNININIDSKTAKINIPQINIKNTVVSSKNNYSMNNSNKYDTQRIDKNKNKTLNFNNNTYTAKKTINNIFNKFSFNKKDIDKQKK